MIHRLRVRRYKSLRDCEVQLAPISVLLGPNGAGKSNLLDLIGFVSQLASRETVREALKDHRGRPLEAFHAREGFGKKARRPARVLLGDARSLRRARHRR
jgi:predicted ATPase